MFDFPSTPAVGDIVQGANGADYRWDGVKWVAIGSGGTGGGGGGGGASITVSDTPPDSPINGALWFDSVSANLFIYYTDPDSSAWVVAVNEPEGGLGEAPQDGITYGRRGSDETWQGVLPLVGGTMATDWVITLPPTSDTTNAQTYQMCAYKDGSFSIVAPDSQAGLWGYWSEGGDETEDHVYLSGRLIISISGGASAGPYVDDPLILMAAAGHYARIYYKVTGQYDWLVGSRSDGVFEFWNANFGDALTIDNAGSASVNGTWNFGNPPYYAGHQIVWSYTDGNFAGANAQSIHNGSDYIIVSWNNTTNWVSVTCAPWSDRRLKTDVKPASRSALDLIHAVQVYEADIASPIDKSIRHHDFALMADEIEQVIPLAYIPPVSDINYAAINTNPLVMTLWRAVQELSSEVRDLQAEVAALKARR